jgi:hypothetical protein
MVVVSQSIVADGETKSKDWNKAPIDIPVFVSALRIEMERKETVEKQRREEQAEQARRAVQIGD